MFRKKADASYDLVVMIYKKMIEKNGMDAFIRFVIGGLPRGVWEEAQIIADDYLEGANWIENDAEWDTMIQKYLLERGL